MKKIICLLFISILFISCAEPPTAKLITVENLKESNSYYSNVTNYINGDNMLGLAKQEIKYQNGKFPLFRNFDKACVLLENSEVYFNNIQSVVTPNQLKGTNIITEYNVTNYVRLDNEQFERLIKVLEKR